MGQCGHFFPSTSLSLSPQLLFQQLGPCPALLAEPAVGSVAQGTPAPLQPPLFTAHFPTAVTGKFCNRGGKGGGPVDNFSAHIHPSHSEKLKSRHTKTAEPRQAGNSAPGLPFGLGTALFADQ